MQQQALVDVSDKTATAEHGEPNSGAERDCSSLPSTGTIAALELLRDHKMLQDQYKELQVGLPQCVACLACA